MAGTGRGGYAPAVSSPDGSAPAQRIVADRLVLEPVPLRLARAIVAGDLSGVRPGRGWPHDDTLDGLRMMVEHGGASDWFVTLDGVVIGDCGTHGGVDEAGDVEIGYGLAAPYRGNGYGTELVAALTGWLLGRPGVRRVVARHVLADNMPSRRALERTGFALERVGSGHVDYALPYGDRKPST